MEIVEVGIHFLTRKKNVLQHISKIFTGPLVKNVNGYVRLVGVVSGGSFIGNGINCSYIGRNGRDNSQEYANVPLYLKWIKYAFTLLLS